MGSNEVSRLVEESILESEAPKQAVESSSLKEYDSVVSVTLLSGAEPATSGDNQPAPVDETLLVLEDPKEDLETSSFEECGSLLMEFPSLEYLSPLREDEETGEGALLDGSVWINSDTDTSCRETENKAAAIDVSGGVESKPEFDKLLEVDRGINEMCLNEINLKNDGVVSDLKSVASSEEDSRFPGADSSSNTLGECQMVSQEHFGAVMGVEDGGLYFPHNTSNLSVNGNTVSIMGINGMAKCLHVDPHTVTSSSPYSSTEWCEKTSSGHIDSSFMGIKSEKYDRDHNVLGDHCFPVHDRVLSVGRAYALERSNLLPDNIVENLPESVKVVDSLQFCDPEIVMGSGSPCDTVRQDTFRVNSIQQGNNSVAMADISCFTYETRGNAGIADDTIESNEALFSLRRSSREKKISEKTSNRKYTRKGSKKASYSSMDLLSAAIRSKRSCLNRSARVSSWGLIENLPKYIKLHTRMVDQGSEMFKSGGRSRKKDKVPVGASSDGVNSKSRNCDSSGHVSFKLKLVRKDKSVTESSNLTGINLQVKPLTGAGDNELDLSNCIKEVAEGSSIKLEKSAMVLENSATAVHSEDKVLEVTLMAGKCSIIGGSNLSDKEVQKSEVSTDDRNLNSGTSPDSEVIHVPNSQSSTRELEFHNGGMGSWKATGTPEENGTPAMSTMGKKGRKKDKICQLGDSDVQNKLMSSFAVEKTEMFENNGKSGTNSNMAARLNVGHEPVDSLKSKKLLPSAESKGNRKPKNLKLKEKTEVKSKPASAPKLKKDSSRKGKGDKWKLIGKYPISDNGISDLAYKKEDEPEAAGKHGIDDSGNTESIGRSRVTSDTVTSLPVITGGAGQQRTQPRTAWVCCDDCLKWRCISANLADIIDETNCRWYCKDNKDKAFADCSVPQEKSNAEINAELNISEDEDGRDVHLSGKYYSMNHSAVPQQSSWMQVKSNIFLHRSRNTQTLDEIMVCHCKPSRDGKFGCGDECLNRMLNIECVSGTCPCGDLCSNQQFQKQSYAKLKWFRCGKKGFGLQALESVTEGQFLIEYVGEVLDLPSYEARQREYASKGHKHFYFMTLNGNEVIDACAKGNLGRFINHSCDPNCRTEKWMVNGEICIGLFAVKEIKKGEELTFDYNYVRVFGAAAKKCYCGSPQCRGYIGGDRLNNEVVVQSDSDEEFPEPVVIYENGIVADDINIMSESSSLDVIEEKKDNLLQNDANISSEGKDMTIRSGVTSVVSQLCSIAEKDVRSSVFEWEKVDKSPLIVQQESPSNGVSMSVTSRKRSENTSLNTWYPEFLSKSVDARSNKFSAGVIGGNTVHSKGRPRMKISRPSKPIKSKESNDCGSGATAEKATVTNNKFQATPTKLKKLVETSTKHHIETVEEKLNELLDEAGGICKRKDAFKGYLRLLVLTAASGDRNHHETIQSNKDLSMILDAILKTKSRTVLTDILNKNGLQMLHSMMKKCRGNFNMIPILRKLLKVFRFLAERNILTLEHINGDSPRPGVERFRDSMLNLTEHADRKVHQIARNFRDKWIPRPVKKFNCIERAPNGSRAVGSNHHWSDHAERPSESTYSTKQSHPPGNLIDSDTLEGSSHFSECLTNMRGRGKRKSRWDQSPDTVSPHIIKEQKTEPLRPWKKEEEIDDDLHTLSEEMEDDGPPGFSCPSKDSSSVVIPICQQYPGPLKCPSQVPLGYSQERFNSSLPVAYGIPLSYVQDFGTPQASTADGWVIAPGMPFRPFPPLPLCPREVQKSEAHQGYSSSARFAIPTVNAHQQHDKGQQRQNDLRKPPWGFNRNGFGAGRNFSRRPSGVVNDRNEHPEV